ncbi:unnamed protein product, partial [Brenthis ino]
MYKAYVRPWAEIILSVCERARRSAQRGRAACGALDTSEIAQISTSSDSTIKPKRSRAICSFASVIIAGLHRRIVILAPRRCA